MDDKDRNKKRIIYPGDFEKNSQNCPSKPIYLRGRSLSFSAPVHRDIYESQPESPASKFLAEFACRDDYYEIAEFEEGKVINNYLIGQTIGGGVYSECREAYILNCKDSNIPDKVALKIITDPRYLSTFKREIETWSRLTHPNILPLLDSFSGEGYIVAVSVLAENGNLHSYISNHGKLSENLTLHLFRQILSAVHYLHEKLRIAHLDIKLENILLRKNFDIYLCDFGMSFGADDLILKEDFESFDANEQFCSGSITSLPPEVLSSSCSSIHSNAEDKFELKKKQDIWALGVALYAMITGGLPFSDDFLPRLQYSIISGEYKPFPEELSLEIKLLISNLLHKNPYDRPSIKDIMGYPCLNK